MITLLALTFGQFLSAQTQTDEQSIKGIVKEFIEATDVQDAERLAATMHDQAMQYVKFGPRFLSFDKATYVAQLKDKKVGGLPRTILYGNLIRSGKGVATQVLEATSSKLKFLYQVSLIKTESGWLITSINTEVSQL